MNLYKVTLQGMTDTYGTSYAVAGNPDEAYQMVLEFLTKEDLGYARQRVLKSVELIAESHRHTTMPKLYLRLFSEICVQTFNAEEQTK
jgi:hypothetical protein